jgi:hypothetical protein
MRTDLRITALIILIIALYGGCATDEEEPVRLSVIEMTPDCDGPCPVNIVPELLFSSAVSYTTVTPENLEFVDETGKPAAYTVSYFDDDRRLVIQPDIPLDYEKNYHLRVHSAVHGYGGIIGPQNTIAYNFETTTTPRLITDIQYMVQQEMLAECDDQSCVRGMINAMLDDVDVDIGDFDAYLSDSKGDKLAATGDGELVYWGREPEDVMMYIRAATESTLFYSLAISNTTNYYGPDFTPAFPANGALRIATIRLSPDPLDIIGASIYIALDGRNFRIEGEITFNSCGNLFFDVDTPHYFLAECDLTDISASAEVAGDGIDYIALQCGGSLPDDCGMQGADLNSLGQMAGEHIGPYLSDAINAYIPADIAELVTQTQ